MPDASTRPVSGGARPFARHEWLIAWRYMRARRREGGVSTIVWYALVGIALAVGTLIVVMSVMSGFREEFTSRILGAEGHVNMYPRTTWVDGRAVRDIHDYEALAIRVAGVPGVIRAAPMIERQALLTHGQNNSGAVVRGMRGQDLLALPWIANPEQSQGSLDRYGEGIALGWGVARELGVGAGDRVTMILPNGRATPFGMAPKQKTYEVTYVFRIGRSDVDRTRVFMPFEEAQDYFNRQGVADMVEAVVERPDALGTGSDLDRGIRAAAGDAYIPWTWKDANGAFLSALDLERNTMFMILSLVVLIAALNIVSGLVMLVKNKGRDIGILRTMGLPQGAILRIFFLCGAGIGALGTIIGTILGVLFVIYIDPIFGAVDFLLGGGVWDPEVRLISRFPAELSWPIVLKTSAMALGLSFAVTWFPARRAARLDPVEALRYE
ncbi:lipoprotein-releasing ABC transporter permease subunit [Rhodovulum sp. DZ06]|uniref:lipoprotein-releasing ABC transporter permease subunit n=1 Tax=Rhodovulum sp. DZ06 TaxID=3425126 RepID=UPI003D3415C0